MNPGKRTITDEELDALLSGSPVAPQDSFAERILIKASPVSEVEVDVLLAGNLVTISPDFTERTLDRIEAKAPSNIFRFPGPSWLVKMGMVAAVLLVGLFSYSVWQGQSPSVSSSQVAQIDIAGMELEELLYLEETLASAKVLIELEKTVPLYIFFNEADS
ncbi:MAG: hypothetical protein O7C75_07645 [Verrucomicrobia bacterium]|nr:hypothetical protein [Verrucomicrobiota bacterium]